MATSPTHDSMANAIRFLAVDAVEKAKSGHPGLPMGAADVATVLFRDVLKFDAADPHWPDRDRFVLSAGHGSMLLYALLYLTGMGGDKGLTIDDLKSFRQVGSKTPGTSGIRPHDRRRNDDGSARAGDRDRGRHGDRRADDGRAFSVRRRPSHLCARLRRRPDGGRQPGGDRHRRPLSAQQAHRLLRRQRHFDRRPVRRSPTPSIRSRASSSAGWNASHVDGRDLEAILNAIRAAQNADRPTMIACKTTIGFGSPTRQGTQQGARRRVGRGRSRRRAQEPQLALSSRSSSRTTSCRRGGTRARAASRSARPG